VVGEGDETVVFSHGFLMNHEMFRGQIDRLRGRYRVIAYDHRGHGGSDPCPGPFDVYRLMDDGARVIEQLADGKPVHWVGMSTGGYVGTRLMIRRPELLRSATLIDTGAHAEPADSLRQYDLMLGVVRWVGVRPVFPRAIRILMGEPFRTDPARRAEYEAWKERILALDRKSLVSFGNAIFRRDDVTEALRGTTVPALVMVGELDEPTPPATARALADAVGADVVTIPQAGHTSPVERPDEVSDALEEFLGSLDS